MTVAEIGCGRYLQSTGFRMLKRDGRRRREHGIPSPGDEQEPISESQSVRLLCTCRQVGPGMVGLKRLDIGAHEYASVTLHTSLPR